MGYATVPLAVSDHRQQVVALWRSAFGSPPTAHIAEDRFSWIYGDGRAVAAHTELGLDTETGAIVGCGSVCPRVVHVAGRPVKAGMLSDFAVLPAHRTGAVALSIQRALLERMRQEGVQLLYARPSRAAASVLHRVGYGVLGEVTRFVRLLRTGPLLERHFGGYGPLRTVASVVDPVLGTLDGLCGRLSSLGLVTAHLDAADERFDALLARQICSSGIAFERRHPHLNWRYGGPGERHRYFAVMTRDEREVRAFLVYSVVSRAIDVLDIVADPGGLSLMALLLRFAEEMRSTCDSMAVHLLGGPKVAAQLRRLGFLERPTQGPVLVFIREDVEPQVRRALLDPSLYCIFEGELDI